MASFVLVHGAFGAGRVWRNLTPLLQARGHQVFAPTLTGLGERAHLGGPQTDLTTHIQDVVGVLECEDLSDMVLVGHSYGGMVITGVADRAPERIDHLVYLDALLPAGGEAGSDMEGFDELLNRPLEDGWLLLLPEMPPDAARPPSRGHPLATLTEKLKLDVPIETRPFTRTYVIAAGNPRILPEEEKGNFWRAAKRVRQDPAWRYFEVPFGHAFYREQPEIVAGILLNLVHGTAREGKAAV